MIEFSRSRWDKSQDGWTYCLSTECKTYCKIGRTEQSRVMDRYPTPYKAPQIGGAVMYLRWAIPNAKYEKDFHRVLRWYRMNVMPESLAGRSLPDDFEYTSLKQLGTRKTPKGYTQSSCEIFLIHPKYARRRIRKWLTTGH